MANIPEPPERNYYEFEALPVLEKSKHYDFDTMKTSGAARYMIIRCDSLRSAKKARSAAHVTGTRKGWKFRTHLVHVDNGEVDLNIWRIK